MRSGIRDTILVVFIVSLFLGNYEEEEHKQIVLSDNIVYQKATKTHCDLFLASWVNSLPNTPLSLPLPLPALTSDNISMELNVQDTLSVVLFKCLISRAMYLMSHCITAKSDGARDSASIELFETLEKLLDVYDMSSGCALK